MTQRNRIATLAALTALGLWALAGCYITPAPGPAPAPTPGPPPPTVVGGAPATLTIKNIGNEALWYVHMSLSSDSSWGPDLLASDQTIAVNTGVTFGNIVPGEWDVAVFDRIGNCKLLMRTTFAAGGAYTLDVDSDEWRLPDQCPSGIH